MSPINPTSSMRLIFVAILLVFSRHVYSQYSNHSGGPLEQSVSVSFATITGDDIFQGYRPGRPTTHEYSNKTSGSGLCIAYKHNIDRRLSIGISLISEWQHGDWLDNKILNGNVFDLQTNVKGSFIRTGYTTAADLTYDYFVYENVRLYLICGIGYTYVLETDQYNIPFYNTGYANGVNTYGPMRVEHNGMHLNGYVAPIGLRVGGKLSYFIEFGLGYRGALNTGIACNL